MEPLCEPGSAPSALLLCGSGTLPRETITGTVASAGLEIVALVDNWSEAVRRVVELRAEVAIVDMSSAGSIGVRVVSVLRAAAPWCEVIVISPWEQIDVASLEAGAAAVIQPSDLRPLRAALETIVRTRTKS